MSAALGCPRCGAWLEALRTRSAQLFGCRGCGGVWLDNAATRRLIDALCDETLHHTEALGRYAERQVERTTALDCPSCRHPLARWNVPEANIDVDWCQAHGTWFDRDELAGVTRAYAARRAYGGGAALPAGAAVAGGVAVAGGAAAGAAIVASDPSFAERARQTAAEVDPELVADVGLTAVELVDAADVIDGAGVVADGAGALFGVLGDILSGLDF